MLAAEAGLAGVVLSNHGGRQLVSEAPFRSRRNGSEPIFSTPKGLCAIRNRDPRRDDGRSSRARPSQERLRSLVRLSSNLSPTHLTRACLQY